MSDNPYNQGRSAYLRYGFDLSKSPYPPGSTEDADFVDGMAHALNLYPSVEWREDRIRRNCALVAEEVQAERLKDQQEEAERQAAKLAADSERKKRAYLKARDGE